MGTSQFVIPVPLFDLKPLIDLAAHWAGTSNRRHWRAQTVVNKISWQKAGRVTEPGRYMFTFGYLTVTESDLAVWKQFPHAMFTLVELPPDPANESPSTEFHLGAFELPSEA
jgi:hypothetical protein